MVAFSFSALALQSKFTLITTDSKSKPKNGKKNKQPAGTTTYHTKYHTPRTAHNKPAADHSFSLKSYCSLSSSASLSILNGAAHWPEWAHKSHWWLPEVGSLQGKRVIKCLQSTILKRQRGLGLGLGVPTESCWDLWKDERSFHTAENINLQV